MSTLAKQWGPTIREAFDHEDMLDNFVIDELSIILPLIAGRYTESRYRQTPREMIFTFTDLEAVPDFVKVLDRYKVKHKVKRNMVTISLADLMKTRLFLGIAEEVLSEDYSRPRAIRILR